MLVGIWGAAQTALLGPEGEAFLQQLGQVHELRSHCCYGMKHSASVLVQDRISLLMLLWRHPMVRQSSTLHVCVFMCVLLGMARAGCGKDRQKDAWRDKSSRLSPRHYQRRLLCGSEQVSVCMCMFYWMDGWLDVWMDVKLFFLCRNVIHGSDSVDSAQREISLWFEDHELFCWEECSQHWIYAWKPSCNTHVLIVTYSFCSFICIWYLLLRVNAALLKP